MRAILGFVLACSAAVGVALVLLRGAVSGFLSPDAGVSELIVAMSLVYAATILFRNVDFALGGVLNGLKLTKVTGLVSVASAVLAYWLVPALAMTLEAGYLVVVSCMGMFHLACLSAYALVLARLLRAEGPAERRGAHSDAFRAGRRDG